MGLIFATWILFAQASSEVVCAPGLKLLTRLSEEYQEELLGIGKTGDVAVVVLRNPDTGSWSIVHQTKQVGCLVSGSRSGWVDLVPIVEDLDE